MRKVSVQRVRSRGQTTDQDLTAPMPAAVKGEIVELRVGMPLEVRVDEEQLWRTSPVEHIEESTRGAEVVTRRTVYRLRYL